MKTFITYHFLDTKGTRIATKKSNLLPVLLISFLGLNALQASFTLLTSDETYYTAWAARLDWGYFDHPTGVAAAIRLFSTWNTTNSLLIRLSFVISEVLALGIIFKKIAPAWSGMFPIWLGIPILHVYGWLATPDALLLLGAVCFFVAYHRFTTQGSWPNSIWLGISMGAMVWCKYHGVLVILFTLLSNWNLVRNIRAWVAVFISLLIFAPHLYWQWQYGFPTFFYHLSERSPESFVLRHSVEFVINQLILYHPVLIILAFYTAIKNRKNNPLEKALYWNMMAFPSFFLITTINNYAEPHWTYPIIIPIIYFLAAYAKDRPWNTGIKNTISISVLLILCARVGLMISPSWFPWDGPGNRAIAETIGQAAGDLPIAVANSYQIAAVARYYLQKPVSGIAIANRKSRANQFTEIWDDEMNLQGDTVFVVSPCRFYEAERLTVAGLPDRELWGKKVYGFRFLKKFIAQADVAPPDMGKDFSIHLSNPYDFDIAIDKSNWSLLAIVYREGWQIQSIFVDITPTVVPAHQSVTVRATRIPIHEEHLKDIKTDIQFSLAGKHEPFPINSKPSTGF